jgi:acetyl esterase/lipase
MIQQTMKESAAHPQSPQQRVADYRAMMLKINPYKFPVGFKSTPVASFEPRRELRAGLTAAIAIPLGNGPFPIMIHAHGHGLAAGRPPEYEPWIREMSSHGFVVMFPDFRWQPEHSYSDQIDDMNFSINWARQNASHIHGDPERLTLGGDSGGAGLAFDVLLRSLEDPKGARFKAFASVDGDIAGQQEGEGANLLSRLKPETPLPPVFLIVGSADHTAMVALKTADKFMDLKKNFELAVFYGMPHDFEKFPQLSTMHQANDRMMNFLKKAA